MPFERYKHLQRNIWIKLLFYDGLNCLLNVAIPHYFKGNIKVKAQVQVCNFKLTRILNLDK